MRKNVSYIEGPIHDRQARKRRWIHKEGRNEMDRGLSNLERFIPTFVEGSTTEPTTLPSERRRQGLSVINELILMVLVCLDVIPQNRRVARGATRERSHVEGEEKLERRPLLFGGSVSISDPGWLPRIPANI